ncbi:MAG: hypothetical protein FWH24_04425 [Oscillospiraceae bacterium]|nr:hypothetical protein [Oscillospiraceae bacterium]
MNDLNIEYKRNNIFKNKKTGSAAVNAGGAIIIIIFVVLCLTIFGLLSFTTAFADKRLADRTLTGIQQYYAADTLAEQTLAAVYAQFKTGGPGAVENAVIPDGVEIIDIFDSADRIIITYQTPLNEVQALYSEVALFYNGADTEYNITKWHVVLTADFDYENQGADVWDGGFEEDFWWD